MVKGKSGDSTMLYTVSKFVLKNINNWLRCSYINVTCFSLFAPKVVINGHCMV